MDVVAGAVRLNQAGEEAGASSSSRGFKFATRDDEQAGARTHDARACGGERRGQAAWRGIQPVCKGRSSGASQRSSGSV